MLRTPLAALLAAALLAGACVTARADAPVGVAGAVNPKTESTPPGAQTRTVMVGSQMLMNEKVVTGPQGSTQLIFTDHSTLTIGPSSEVVIDQFVYNPADSSGKMAVSLSRGVMRLVGGELSHKGAATITTPSATVGIRGGIVMIRASGPETAVINLFGNTDVTATHCDQSAQRCTVSILRPGFGTTVTNAAPPAAPSLVPSDQMVTLTVQLQSSPAQNGGATQQPTDSNTQASGTGQSNGGLVAHNVVPQAPQGGGVTPPDPNNQGLGNTAGLFGTSTTNVGDITQQQQLAMDAGGGPTTFPDGLTSIGDLRTVAGPTTFTYNQANVAILYNGTPVGSYDFDLTVHLGPPSSRSIVANATSINVAANPGLVTTPWPYASVTNASLNFTMPAPDFQFAGMPSGSNVIGFGVSSGCGDGVNCSLGFNMRNSGGTLAAFADHNLTVYPSTFTDPPPPTTPNIGFGSGTAPRVVH